MGLMLMRPIGWTKWGRAGRVGWGTCLAKIGGFLVATHSVYQEQVVEWVVP